MKIFKLRFLRDFVMLAGCLLLASCASTPKKPATWSDQHAAFRQTEGWKKKVFLNPPVYEQMSTSRSSVKVSLADQRGYLLLDGEHVALDFPVATGRRNYRTPTGSYKVLQKKVEYASNLYGKHVDIASGRTVNSDADSRKPTPEGAKFVGAKMPYWMRLTNSGVGLHIGYVPGHPASHGCIRVVRSAMEKVFPMCKIGTSVEIVEKWDPWEGMEYRVLDAQQES